MELLGLSYLNWAQSVLPKSVNPKRIAENLGVFDYDAEDTAAIDGINLDLRYNDASTDFGYVFCEYILPPCSLNMADNPLHSLRRKVPS